MAPADAARPITTALLGCGNSGRHYHLPLLLDDPRFDLRVVATGQGGSAADLALPPGVVRCGGWQQALGHDVELVVVALPHHLHHPVASAALDAGRHVLVEKPLATTLAEADDLLARAEASGRVLAVHHQRRWEADVVTLSQVIASGEIGEVWRAIVVRGHQGDYTAATPAAPHVGDQVVDWVRSRACGGGVARLIGPHPVDHLLTLVGAPVATVAGRTAGESDDDVDAWFSADVTFTSGAEGHVEVFRRLGVPPPRATVWGTEGMAVAGDGSRVEVRRHDGTTRVVDGLPPIGRLGGEVYDDVAHAVRHGGPLRVPARHARDVVAVIELAERSAARGGAPLVFR